MDVLYGEGEFIQDDIRCRGKIILGDYKLFLRGPAGDLTQTYLSLDKIVRVKKTGGTARIDVRLSPASRYTAVIKSDAKNLKELVLEIVKRRNLKKRFWFNEWVE